MSRISPNLFDCAQKQIERNVIQADFDKYLANGGLIKTIQTSFKPRSEVEQVSDLTQRVLSAIKGGAKTTRQVVLVTKISAQKVLSRIDYLIAIGEVKKVRVLGGRRLTHAFECVGGDTCL